MLATGQSCYHYIIKGVRVNIAARGETLSTGKINGRAVHLALPMVEKG